ncbi:DUF6151 family protein [Qipengyuania soli]|uniref:DUF6151 family protein n=1 Tax=Qipengyuania soli TaxID=2782568 RepID=UPI001FE394F3|nr:DUF6151 family protein [Qipengyuania soli]
MNFACECGAVAGTIDKATSAEGDHVICHCKDCRDLVRHFGKEARILDANGGTALYQSRCARMHLNRGKEMLAGLHMTDGPTLRWYAKCCGTPMFNAYKNGRIPYITTLLANCDQAGRNALGAPLGHLFLDEATGDTSLLRPLSMGRLMRRFFRRMVKDIVTGDRRRSELYDAATLEPIAKPRHLSAAEQHALGRA